MAENEYGIDKKLFLITAANRVLYGRNTRKRSILEKLTQFTASSNNASFHSSVRRQYSLSPERKKDLFHERDDDIIPGLSQHHQRFEEHLLESIPDGLSSKGVLQEKNCALNIACNTLRLYALMTRSVPQSSQSESTGDETHSSVAASGEPIKNSQATLSRFVSSFILVCVLILLELLRSDI